MSFNFAPRTLLPIVILLIIWALAYIIGMIVGKKDPDDRRRFHPAGKVTMMLCTIAAAVWMFFLAPDGSPVEFYTRWIIAGLIFGLMGDITLAKLLPIKHTLVPGMVVFGIGHIFYLAALFSVPGLLDLNKFGYFPIALLAVSALYYFGWRRVVKPIELGEKGKRGLLIYGLMLVFVTVLICYAAFVDRQLSFFAIGITLFLISDLILIGDLTGFYRFKLIGDVVWIIYAVGQMLIAFSSAMML